LTGAEKNSTQEYILRELGITSIKNSGPGLEPIAELTWGGKKW
jgi:hypothetical protein